MQLEKTNINTVPKPFRAAILKKRTPLLMVTLHTV